MLERLNAGRRQRLGEEMSVMRELPVRRMESARRDRVKVDSGMRLLLGVAYVHTEWGIEVG
jgi:hypothetical protein